MIKEYEYIDWIASAIGVSIGYFFGEFDGLIRALFFMIIVNYITGVFATGIEHKLSSNVGYTGIKRKVTMLLLVCFYGFHENCYILRFCKGCVMLSM